MDIIENGMVTNNVGLNLSEPDSIIGQNHVYDLSFLFLREYGPPSSFQVYLINLVFFFFEHASGLPLPLHPPRPQPLAWHPPLLLPPSPPLWIPPLTLTLLLLTPSILVGQMNSSAAFLYCLNLFGVSTIKQS